MTNGNDVLAVLDEIYAGLKHVRRELRPSDRLREDLGIDSLAAIDLMVAVEERYGIELVTDTRIAGVRTVGELADLVTAEAAGLRPLYDAFLALNDEFKAVCTAWQIHDDAPNDHTDAQYDAEVVGALSDVVERAGELLTRIAAIQPDFGGYLGRLATAVERVRAGDRSGFTGVMQNSCHDVWMELHRALATAI